MSSEYAGTPLGKIAHIEMGQSPDSSTVLEGEAVGVPFLQGNAEFGSLYPFPRFTCVAPMKMCKAGDILISVRAPVGAINIADRDYCIGRGLAAVRIDGMTSRLAAHVISAAAPTLRRVAQGTTFEAINKADLASLQVKAPTNEDRDLLSQFLDTLDTTIRQTEAIIAKLKQVKQGLLHDLLTRGIDANGELRPPQSEAPPTWGIERIGALMDGAPRNGIYKPASDIGEGTLLIGQTAFTSSGSVDASLARRARLTRAEQEMFGLRREDLLVSRVFATRDGVGQPVLVPEFGEPAVFESNMMRVRCNADLVRAPYLFYWLKHRASRTWLMSRAFASNQASINRETLCGVPVHLPPLYEQDQIMSMISAEDARLEHEVDQLMKLKQLKSGLMDDLLTGRVRVTPLLAQANPTQP